MTTPAHLKARVIVERGERKLFDARLKTEAAQQAVISAQAALAEAQGKLAATEEALSTAKSQEVSLATSLAKRKNEARSFYWLPDDVLNCIFIACAQSVHEDTDYTNIRINEVRFRLPIILSSVRRRWRNVALSRSWLWSYIGIDLKQSTTPANYKLITRKTSVYLQRSQRSPLLDVTLLNIPQDPNIHCPWVIASTVSQAHRLRSLVLGFTNLRNTTNFAPFLAGPFPQLQEFSLKSAVEAVASQNAFQLQAIDAPRLISLDIWNVTIEPESFRGSNYANLENLYLRTTESSRHILSVLAACPNVKHLQIDHSDEDDDDTLPLATTDITLRACTSATITLCQSTVQAATHLSFPVLERLVIWETSTPEHFATTIQRLGSAVPKIELHEHQLIATHASALQQAKGLVTLTLKECTLCADFFELLQTLDFPSWRSLVIEEDSEFDSEYESEAQQAFVHCVESICYRAPADAMKNPGFSVEINCEFDPDLRDLVQLACEYSAGRNCIPDGS